MALEITTVTRDSTADRALRNFSVDLPIAAADDGHLIEVSGWAVGRDFAVVAMDVRTASAVVATGTFGLPRPDVPEAMPELAASENCGFRAVVSTLGLPEDLHLYVVVHLADGAFLSVGEIKGTRSPLPAPPRSKLEPLLVTSLGRSGSTWLMHLLGKHPDVVVFDEWPYELKGLLFFQRWLQQAVTRPHGTDQPTAFAYETDSWWGQSPFGRPGSKEWFGGEHVALAARACREATVSFYRAAAERQDKPRAQYFAEKSEPLGDGLTMELFGQPRQIMLVRDFRDMVCSIISYNRKHGLQEFGAHLATSDAELPEVVASAVRGMATAAAQRPTSLVVRYEDLVAEPDATLTRVLQHLALPADPTSVARTILDATEHLPGMAIHRTTESQAQSVGRWRTDLEPAVAAACERAFGDALEAFGYAEPGRASRWRRLLRS